jgi:hypothetical protein
MNTPETPDTQQQPTEPAVPAVEPTPVAAILETVELPAATDAGSAEPGGEWQELLDRLNGWLGEGRVSEMWQQSQRPLKALGAALALLLVLRLLGSVLGALDGVPMLPRLLQLVGLIWLGLYSSRNLVRSDSRQQLQARVDGIWGSVVGRAD